MKTSAKQLMMVVAVAAMTACSKTDLYDADAINENAQQKAKVSFAENFARKYPNVDMSRGWDFSSKNPVLTFGNGVAERARTRAGENGGSWSAGDWYYVDNNTLDWMHDALVEGKDHRNLGKAFYMTVPGNEFTIVPIYQGVAAAMWDLHVVIDGVDYKVWEKISKTTLGGSDENVQDETEVGTIQIKDLDSDEWHNMHGQWFDWGYGHWESLYNTDGTDRWTPDWSAKNQVTAVRSIPYTFKNFRVGAEMYFYLEITKDGNERDNQTQAVINHRNDVRTKQSSVKGMMLALQNCPVPANLNGNEVMIVGCEDADVEKYDVSVNEAGEETFKGSDWDMNDLVLLVYGKNVPKPIEIHDGDTFEERTTVRYMIEDLGSTDDFDFNDIVVDVADINIITPTYTNGVLTSQTVTVHRQEAVIRHLGGILPFTLKIGDKEYQAGGQETFKTSPDLKIDDVTGWNIQTHNVSVEVEQRDSEGVFEIQFPLAGEAPMIIAVDPSQNWMNERQGVPESWFY